LGRAVIGGVVSLLLFQRVQRGGEPEGGGEMEKGVASGLALVEKSPLKRYCGQS